ncbi:MAG TPA: FAD-dependent oxidoreductase [Candidatus Saccharimonadales bacterium]|nr:FAD-dependent oxidoreductase [Candidatus Saccharimonadales bacterium]
MKRIVIVGGGFGGVRAAINLAGQADYSVKLISKNNYFEYHPALYRAATGRSPFESAISLADFFESDQNIEVVCDEVTELDISGQKVIGASGSVYPYDEMILALGSVTNYMGIKGLAEYSYGIKSIQEALEFKRKLHEDLVSGQRAEHNYVVIGGGPTGVELAGELSAYIKHIRKSHHLNKAYAIDVIEAGPRLLPALPEAYARRVSAHLKHLGIDVHLNTRVMSEEVDQLDLPRGHISSHIVAWTAGVTNNPFFASQGQTFKFGKGGRVAVDEHLMALPHVYVIGDNADTPYCGIAQTALHDANYVTELITKGHTQPYQAKKPISAIPVGPNWAAVQWGKLSIYGYLGWVLRRLADLRLFLQFMPMGKAFRTWESGFEETEVCPICAQAI